ncbi:MAG: DNA methyltransferase, partial [Bacteroidales bacterium]|nr:DNA methyltransferase [Bacteroidales bacterium]
MDNWIIENDNLVALNDLLPEYEGKIDLMPIDPPYNTKIDYIGYKDSNFANGWCAFIQPRLEIAYKLLSEKGVMFICIDENELVNLLGICGSIFGVENVSIFTWKKTNEHYDKNRVEKPLENGVRRTNEFIVACFKNREKSNLNPVLQPVWNGSKYIDVVKPL